MLSHAANIAVARIPGIMDQECYKLRELWPDTSLKGKRGTYGRGGVNGMIKCETLPKQLLDRQYSWFYLRCSRHPQCI